MNGPLNIALATDFHEEEETHLAYPLISLDASSPQISSTPNITADIQPIEPTHGAEFSIISLLNGSTSDPAQPSNDSSAHDDPTNNDSQRSDILSSIFDPHASLNLPHSNFTPEPMRISKFSKFLNAPNNFSFSLNSAPQQPFHLEGPIDETPIPPLFSILASVGQYSPLCEKTAEDLEMHEDMTRTPLSSPKFLQCAGCPTRISLSDLPKFTSQKPATHTRELLGRLSEQHHSECASRPRVSQMIMASERLSKPIEEGSDLTAVEITGVAISASVIYYKYNT